MSTAGDAAIAGQGTPISQLARDSLHRLLIEAVIDYAIYMLDTEGRVVSWNPGAQALKGWSPEEIIGESFARFYTDEDQASGRPANGLRIAAEVGRFESEGWRVRKDGSRFWALTVLDAVRDDDGTTIGFAKITRDITDRHAAQLALEESERQFRLLVAGVKDYAIYMLDLDGRVTSWNAGAEQIKGYSAAEAIGRSFADFYTPEDRAAGLPGLALKNALEHGRHQTEGWRVRKNGDRFRADVVIDPILDDHGQLVGFAKITRDVTERWEHAERLEQIREQLLHAQKMEAIGKLTGGVAHDFNNLLTVIVGGVGMARRRLADPQALGLILDSVDEAARRGGDLTRQLLAFSRRQPLEPEALDVSGRLENVAALLDRSVGDTIKVSVEAPAGLAIEADARQLELALLNVAFNARDAMPRGGRLTLTAQPAPLQGEHGLKGDFVAIAVADTGEGMDEAIRARVFEPFFTTKGVGKGTGLGLSQAYGFAQQSGGAVDVRSKPGKGTTVTFYLPASRRTPVAPLAAAQDMEQAGLAGRKVLLVEDDPAVADMAADLLREEGAVVTHVSCADSATDALDRSSFDLVFSDVVMPGGRNGFDLARELRQRWPGTPVLLATGYSETAAGNNGEFQLLQKPYRPDDLRRAICACLRAAGLDPATDADPAQAFS